MPFSEFLKLVIVIRTLYGTNFAINYFEKNIDLYYNLNYHEINKPIEVK